MGTKREELEKMARGEGCLGKAADDEPIFIIRAQDIVAAETVEFWAWKAQNYGTPRVKIGGALKLATEMRAWPNQKIPD